jgi:localization factor PodJL
MARAFQQSQPVDYDHERNPAEWQSLRNELAALLDQVDGQVARSRGESSLGERLHDLRHQMAEAESQSASRRRDALRSVQRQISRFEEPAERPPNPRDSLTAAIAQIRARQGESLRAAAPQPQPQPARAADGSMLERLAQSVGGLSGRLERLEAGIAAQLKSGANVKDVADQVAQLANVVELLAGAVGETGQVKRLEGQIASLGKIMSQGREVDAANLTRRLDDVAATVGRLAELQVHYADRVQNPVDSAAFRDGMRSIEESVRNVYDRIDALERQSALPPREIELLTGEMARFTEAMRDTTQPTHLVELVDALNARISEIESGDRLVHGLRKDLGALRDAVIVSLMPRFDALEQRLDTLSGEVGTRADMAEIGRQIGALSERIGERAIDPGIGQLEAQVRHLVARMDQTGEQLSGLAKLYSESSAPSAPDIDFEAVAEMVASRTAAAVTRDASASNELADTISGLETRITAMLGSLRRDNEVGDFSDMQAGISEVNERLRRLEASLQERAAGVAPMPAPETEIATLLAEVEARLPPDFGDAMPRNPEAEAPLNAPPFPEPVAEPQPVLRKLHPGLTGEPSLAERHAARPAALDTTTTTLPPAPTPSAGFLDADTVPAAEIKRGEAAPGVSPSSRNTFIEAARRAAQRQPHAAPSASAAGAPTSLIGRALARLQGGEAGEAPAKPGKGEKAPRRLAGDKPSRRAETAAAKAPMVEPKLETKVKEAAPVASEPASESFLLRHRRVILLAAAVVAVAFLTLNLVAQRMLDAPAASGAPGPITTGAIGSGDLPMDAVLDDTLETAAAPRVIDMTDPVSTAAIDSSAARAFTTDALPAMPAAFEAAGDLASTAANTIAPLAPMLSPVTVELPPEAVGPIELRDAAARGDVRAQFEVAAILTEGRALPQDYAGAAVWYERAAAAGFAPAQYRLGSLFENGNGVDKDLENARLWYERAAEAGNRMSMHNLAALYAGGQLGKQQFDSAARWFEEAANRGMTDSQFNLGMLYARGLGVPQSLEDSFKWFGIAALSGDKDAAKARDDVARSLDADTMSRLLDVINNFKPAPVDLAANFAPIGTWSKSFDPGETIAARDIVASVQRALGKLGYDVGAPDGIAGAKTAAAIKSFEQATGMNAVGLINPRLLAVLGSQPV